MDTIRQAAPAVLYLVQDGPRPGVSGEQTLVDEARRVAEAVDWACAVTTVYSETNMGLRNRVTSGLDRVFSDVEQAIILEDDCVADASFFPFAKHMLTTYGDDRRVGTVSGNNFLIFVSSVMLKPYRFSKSITWRELFLFIFLLTGFLPLTNPVLL
jgi:hypothetical protein